MALPRGRRRGALRVELFVCFLIFLTFLSRAKTHAAKVFYDRATLLQLRERSLV